MNNKYYGKLIFELTKNGRIGYSLPQRDYGPQYSMDNMLPKALRRECKTIMPEVDELTVVRHYTNMSNNNFGVDTGFYPLGSCTMKYNPKINEEVVAKSNFQNLHPQQPISTVQGALELYYNVQVMLAEISGLSQFTLNPYAGAHGELTGLMIMRSYHMKRNDMKRTKIIIPNSAHGTNPASAAVCGLKVVEVKTTSEGTVDVEDLKPLLNDEVAGMMMTNPNTLGIFEKEIPEIARLIHECGGLMYYDGANLNPMLGVCRPGDMGFDIMHINLHKTFSTPHGGGGPGAGPVGVKAGLEDLLPNPQVVKKADNTFSIQWGTNAAGQISSFLGNYAIIERAYAYLLSLGRDGISQAGKLATLNANYIKELLKDYYKLPIPGLCKHEFVFDGLCPEFAGEHSDENSVKTLDVAKRLLDYGVHAPTIYFPLLFHEAMMIEPTETESKETLDHFIDIMKQIALEARDQREMVKSAPHCTPVKRLDDVKAVKEPHFTYKSYIE